MENVMNWRTVDQIYANLPEGYRTSHRSGGNSPYSSFDLLLYPEGFVIGVDPGDYVVSEIQLKSKDPARTYKGRHGVGRLIRVIPNPEGIVGVASNEEVTFTLEDGTLLGPQVVKTEGLEDWF
jgi:hypothetical protein